MWTVYPAFSTNIGDSPKVTFTCCGVSLWGLHNTLWIRQPLCDLPYVSHVLHMWYTVNTWIVILVYYTCNSCICNTHVIHMQNTWHTHVLLCLRVGAGVECSSVKFISPFQSSVKSGCPPSSEDWQIWVATLRILWLLWPYLISRFRGYFK